MTNSIIVAPNSRSNVISQSDAVKSFVKAIGAKVLTLSKATKATTFKTIFEETYNYQFICDNAIDVFASTDGKNYAANIPITALPSTTREYWNYLCSLLGIPTVNYCCQHLYDQYYSFKYAIVPKIVKYYSDIDQADRIGIKIGIDSSESQSFIVPIDYQELGEIVDNATGKRATALKYNVNGHKLSLRWIPLDEKVQKLYNARGYFEVALLDKNRICNFAFKIDLDIDTPDIASEEEFTEIWIEGQIVPYVKSSGSIYASFATIFGNLFVNGTFPPTGIFFGVKNGTRDNINFGTCWEVVIPPEFQHLEVVINKTGDIGLFKDVSKLYVTDNSPLSRFVPKDGIVNEKKVVCVYKANDSNKASYTPVHTVVTTVNAVAPMLKDDAADFIVSFINTKADMDEAKALLNEGVGQGLEILQSRIAQATETTVAVFPEDF